MGCNFWNGLWNIFFIGVVIMNWAYAITIGTGVGVILWIIIAAKVEADRMNAGKK